MVIGAVSSLLPGGDLETVVDRLVRILNPQDDRFVALDGERTNHPVRDPDFVEAYESLLAPAVGVENGQIALNVGVVAFGIREVHDDAVFATRQTHDVVRVLIPIQCPGASFPG